MARLEYPGPVIRLIDEMKRLPGVGPRSAERIAIWMLQSSRADPLRLAGILCEAKEAIRACRVCGFFAEGEVCQACMDPGRESVLCVVEQATDVLPMERSGAFRGRYHCLGGKLSPLDDVTPEDLRIGPLLTRIEEGGVEEVILALGADVEGEATANYLAGVLKGRCVVTRIAQGLPAGGGLEHADALTLARALEGRRGL